MWQSSWSTDQLPFIGCCFALRGSRVRSSPGLARVGVLWTQKLKSPPFENLELTNVLPLKSGVGQERERCVSPTARNFFLVLISTFPVHSPSFFLILPYF